MTARPALQKCWNHSAREAVARCPECGHAYCRECVVEHHARVLCAGCLARLTSAPAKEKRRWSVAPLIRAGSAFVGLLVAWFVFFDIGRLLLSIPDKFHADTLWEQAIRESMREEEP